MVRTLSIENIEFLAHTLASALMEWGEPIPPFRTRYPEKLESCLNTITQTFGGKALYPTLPDKAAALFYLLIKNHPFQNGNKRVAVTSLLVFLHMNGHWMEIDTKRLYNFAVWVAESDPSLSQDTIAATTTFIRKHLVKTEVS
jgi:death-on-curing family protein